GGGANAMLFRVLHGVFLPAGLSIAVDGGKALTAQFQRSDQIGAYAVLPLDDKLVAELQKGKDLKVTVQLNQGENVAIAARLQGFGAALDKVMTIK
ncbi:MAG: invasion associated locus B family protein, partial [Hyphomicrobiaceae bacterium]